jgi:hypothetical protein
LLPSTLPLPLRGRDLTSDEDAIFVAWPYPVLVYVEQTIKPRLLDNFIKLPP